MTIVIRADRLDQIVRVILDGYIADIENEYPDFEFEIYLDGQLIEQGRSRGEFDSACMALREIIDDVLLNEFTQLLTMLYGEKARTDIIATAMNDGLMVCERSDFVTFGDAALEPAASFLLKRFPETPEAAGLGT